jgi:hypothetical protein
MVVIGYRAAGVEARRNASRCGTYRKMRTRALRGKLRSAMPWIIEREGSMLRVQIACPVDDWSALFEDLERRLKQDGGLAEVEVPGKLHGASRLDADILVVLRRTLEHRSGISVRTP